MQFFERGCPSTIVLPVHIVTFWFQIFVCCFVFHIQQKLHGVVKIPIIFSQNKTFSNPYTYIPRHSRSSWKKYTVNQIGFNPSLPSQILSKVNSEPLEEVESKYSCVIYCNTSKLRESYQEKKKERRSRQMQHCNCKVSVKIIKELCAQRGQRNESEIANKASQRY